MTEWIRSSHCSGADCLEVAFQRSSFCAGNNCVTVANHAGRVLVRDSKNPDTPVLQFTPVEWAAFMTAIKAGQFTEEAA